MAAISEPLLLLLDDGRAGHYRQAAALADRLSPRQHRLPVEVRQPWRAVAPYRLPAGWAAHPRIRRRLPAERPAVIIGCGRSTALVSRWLKAHWQGLPATVQILHSGISPRHFDYVIAPYHDRISGKNVVRIHGSLTAASDAEPIRAPSTAPGFGGPSRGPRPPVPGAPRCLLLLGGPSRHFRFTRRWLARELAMLAQRLVTRSASLQIVTSPRSPRWVGSLVAGLPAALPWQLIEWSALPAAAARHAYATALRDASLVVASADSVNLLSEACASGHPALVLGAERVTGRVAAGVAGLLGQGYALDLAALEAALTGTVTTRMLDETRRVAALLRDSGLLGGTQDGGE